jgi:hypothetical protein
MQLPSIAEHLGERFIRPLEIDQLCALLRPAIEEIRGNHPSEKLRQLEEHIAHFTQQPAGAGFELPGWLDALEQEMDRVQWLGEEDNDEQMFDPLIYLPQARLSWTETQRQIEQMLDDDEV